VEADLVIDYALKADDAHKRGDHPLGSWVMKRNVVELIAWPMTTRTPSHVPAVQTTRRGPGATRPSLSADAKERFFDHTRRTGFDPVRSAASTLDMKG
jgi:hypothetical protein